MRRFVLLAVVVAVTVACRPSASSSASSLDEAAPREVVVVTAAHERLGRAISVTGTLAAEEQVVLSMKVAGRLQDLLVDLGSSVGAGQAVARVVPTDFLLRIAQAEAALQQARARLGLPPEGDDDRIDPQATAVVRQARAVLDESRLTRTRVATFVERGISSRSELDAADAALQVADSRYQDALEEVRNRQALLLQRRSEVEIARQQLRDTTLLAPFDGVVRERTASPGMYVAPGIPIVTLVRVHPLRLRLEVPERDAAAIAVGQRVRVLVEGDDEAHAGRVARLSPAISEGSRTLLLEAEVPNEQRRLRPGSFAKAEIVVDADEAAVLVPASAVVTFAGLDKVMTVRDGRADERAVRLGRRVGGQVEVVTGLAAGEPVVVEPGNLVNGQAVRARRAE
ncbi:MAG: efflux RND transporter periplasmic adaptor subunit [Acidobacteria bacterium]|nr:efflux RND transporter periplasmic adaptor subunit [Acidobacteriota bacterium]